RGQTDDLHVALVELRLELRHVAEFGRTDRSEVLWVREKDAPRVTEPVVKADLPLCGLGLEIWCGAADTKTHVRYLPGVSLRIAQYEDAALASVSSRKNVAFAHPVCERMSAPSCERVSGPSSLATARCRVEGAAQPWPSCALHISLVVAVLEAFLRVREVGERTQIREVVGR